MSIKKTITFEGLKYNLDGRDRVAAAAAKNDSNGQFDSGDTGAITTAGNKFVVSSLLQAAHVSGSITGANTFTITNSSIGANDVVVCNTIHGGASGGAVDSGSALYVFDVKAGSFKLGITPISGSAGTTEGLVSFADNAPFSASCVVL